MSLNEYLNDLANSIHTQNVEKGWWDKWLEDKWSRHETAMMLTISELAEAMEGDRKDLMDDHLPQHPMFHVELADTLIRLLDLAGAYGIGLNVYSDHLYQQTVYMDRLEPPEQLMRAIRLTLHADTVHDPRNFYRTQEVRNGIVQVLAVCGANEVNVMPIITEKVAYNNQRADHKRENRAKQGGKKF